MGAPTKLAGFFNTLIEPSRPHHIFIRLSALQGSESRGWHPPFEHASPRLGMIRKRDQAGAGLFHREGRGRLAEQHEARRLAEVRFVSHANDRGVIGQGGQQGKYLVGRAVGNQFVADPGRRLDFQNVVENLSGFMRAKKGAG